MCVVIDLQDSSREPSDSSYDRASDRCHLREMQTAVKRGKRQSLRIARWCDGWHDRRAYMYDMKCRNL